MNGLFISDGNLFYELYNNSKSMIQGCNVTEEAVDLFVTLVGGSEETQESTRKQAYEEFTVVAKVLSMPLGKNEGIEEINLRAIELDIYLKDIQKRVSHLISDDYKSGNRDKLVSFIPFLSADCLSYYRHRIYTKLSELGSENNVE